MPRRPGIMPHSVRIQALRKKQGWTQDVAARKAGLNVKSIQKAENDERIDFQTIQILVQLFRDAGEDVTSVDLICPSEFALTSPWEEIARTLLDQWFQQVWGEGDWKLLEHIFAPTFLFHCRVGTIDTTRQLQQELQSIQSLMGPLKIELKSHYTQGSLLSARWVAKTKAKTKTKTKANSKPTTTTEDDFAGAAALPSDEYTGGVTTLKLFNGQVIEAWEYWLPKPVYDGLQERAVLEPLDAQSLPMDIGTPIARKGPVPRSLCLNGDITRAIRQQVALTQEDAAAKAGLSLSAYRKAENGQPVRARTAARIALALTRDRRRVTPDELLMDPSEMRYHSPSKSALGRRVQAWFDAQWNDPAPENLAALATADFTYHMEHGVVRGPGELKERNELFRKSFGDIRMMAEEICDFGQSIVVRWHCQMTHIGPWLDLPATGSRVVIRGSSWVELDGDKFGDAWDFWDPAVIFAQLQHALTAQLATSDIDREAG